MVLPQELINIIMYKFDGLQHQTAKLMKPMIELVKDIVISMGDIQDEDEYASTFASDVLHNIRWNREWAQK